MKRLALTPRRAVMLLVAIIVLVLVAMFAPWQRVLELLGRITWTDILALIGFSLLFHAAKSLRIYLTLRELDLDPPPLMTGLSYLAGNTVASVPGGEAYRPALLKEHADIPAARGSAAVVLQGVVEGAALIIVSLIGALSLGVSRIPVAIVAALLVLVYIILRRGWIVRGRTIINKVPYVSLNKSAIRRFSRDNQRLLRPAPFARLLGVTAVTIFAGAGIVYTAVNAFGREIDPLQAALVYALPTLLAGAALVPGATEASAFGVLALLGVPAGVAAAVVLLQRTFTAFAGVLFGALAYVAVRVTSR